MSFISDEAVNNPKNLSVLRHLSDVIWFGKFKGCTVSHVLNNEATYLEWLMENTDKTYFSKKIQDEINERAQEERLNNESGLFDNEYY